MRLATLLVSLGLAFGGSLHLVFERHTYCPELGTIVHVESADDWGLRGDEALDDHGDRDQHSSHSHDEGACPVEQLMLAPGVLVQPFVLAPVLAGLVSAHPASVAHPGSRPVALLSEAPSHSPPVAG